MLPSLLGADDGVRPGQPEVHGTAGPRQYRHLRPSRADRSAHHPQEGAVHRRLRSRSARPEAAARADRRARASTSTPTARCCPANAYPAFKKYPHLVGNFGGAWQNQQREFDGLPGCDPDDHQLPDGAAPIYSDRIFTTGVVGWPDVPTSARRTASKTSRPVIQKALELGGWTEDEPEQTILTGFGRNAT